MNTDDTAKPQRAMNPESGCAREMTLEEYVNALPGFHLARRKFEHIRFLVCDSQLSDASIRQELKTFSAMRYAILIILSASIGVIVGACVGEYRAELRQPKPCNHPSHLSATNDGSNVLRP